LTEVVRHGISYHADRWNLEKGAAADRLLSLGIATLHEMGATQSDAPKNRKESWARLKRQFLEEVMDLAERESYGEAFTAILGAEIAARRCTSIQEVSGADGCLEVIRWLREGRISGTWKRRIYDLLDMTFTFRTSFLAAGFTLDPFFEEA
jgi:hypothetical protein